MKIFLILVLSGLVSLGIVWVATHTYYSTPEEECQAIGLRSDHFLFLGRCLSMTSAIMTWALVSVTLSTVYALVPSKPRLLFEDTADE